MKIDMQKAYDSIEWPFFEQVQIHLCFPEKFIKWILACVKTIFYSIVINGKPTVPFEAKKRLRQWDPISPFLFVLVMQYFGRILKILETTNGFKYHPKCAKLRLIQLGFADDLLLFCRGDITSITYLYDCFQKNSTTSRLIENISKISIYFVGVKEVVQQQIIHLLGFVKGELSFRYLGVPISIKRLSIMQYQPLLEKMTDRITKWITKFLSYAGKVQLIKRVLFSIQTFWSQVFVLPKKILKKIEALCISFLWTSGVDTSKKALVSWDKLCYPNSACEINLIYANMEQSSHCKIIVESKQKEKHTLDIMGTHLLCEARASMGYISQASLMGYSEDIQSKDIC